MSSMFAVAYNHGKTEKSRKQIPLRNVKSVARAIAKQDQAPNANTSIGNEKNGRRRAGKFQAPHGIPVTRENPANAKKHTEIPKRAGGHQKPFGTKSRPAEPSQQPKADAHSGLRRPPVPQRVLSRRPEFFRRSTSQIRLAVTAPQASTPPGNSGMIQRPAKKLPKPKNMSTGKRKASRCSWSCILVTIGGFMFPKGHVAPAAALSCHRLAVACVPGLLAGVGAAAGDADAAGEAAGAGDPAGDAAGEAEVPRLVKLRAMLPVQAAGEAAGDGAGVAIGPAAVGFLEFSSTMASSMARSMGICTVPLALSTQA